METVALDPHPAGGAPSLLARDIDPEFSTEDRALTDLGRTVKDGGYRFTTVTPASHARIVSRAAKRPPSLADIFGWSRPFAAENLSEKMLTLMADAGALDIDGAVFRSNVRFSTLGDQMFVHSSFPTERADAVFFGPDTYRFARLIREALASMEHTHGFVPSRILDVGAGSGAGGLQAAALAARGRPLVVLADVNQRALRFCKINAAINEYENVEIVKSDLFANTDGDFDLILANPPYLVDPLARIYRHGGGDLGFELSLRIAEKGVSRLASRGRLILYTGSAIVNGIDLFRQALASRLGECGVGFSYEEIDPDVFGEELDHPPYDRADRIAVVSVTIDRSGVFRA
jgi:methylase of polypeptide subunit release factors